MIILSNQHKILIQLSESKEAPQEKLAQALNTNQSSISKALKKLIKDDLVAIKERAGEGKRKKVRLYAITNKGAKIADELQNNIGKKEIVLRSLNGRERAIKFRALNKFLTKELSRSFTTLELLNSLQKNFFTASALLQKSLKTIDFGFEIPELKHFYGRENELKEISEFVNSEAKVFAIKGIAGVGKTYLVTKALEKYSDYKIFWYRVTEFSTVHTFLKYIAEFLITLRSSQLRAYLYSGRVSYDEALLILEGALHGKILIIIDDAHKMQKELVEFCRELFRVVKRVDNVKAIVVGRLIPQCYDTKDLLEGYARELTLEGLDRAASAKLLQEKGIREADRIYEFTKGHPLMLELVRSELTAWSNGYSFLKAEIYDKLDESEKKILALSSVFRAPFSIKLFTENNLNIEAVEGLVTKTLLYRLGEVYNIHDLLKSFLYDLMTENDKIKYHRVASEYYRKEGGEPAIIEAIWHSIKSLDEATATEMILTNKDSFLMKGYLTELINVLNLFKIENIDVISLKAQALLLHGDWDLASRCYNKLLKTGLKQKDNKILAQSYCKFGELLTLRAEYEKAAENLEKALIISESAGDATTIAYAQYLLGRILWLQGKPSEALEILSTTLKLCARENLTQLAGKVSTDLGNAYYLKGELDKSMKLYKKALKIAKVANDSYEVARAYHNMGGLFGVERDFNKAIKWLEKSIKLSNKVGYMRMYGYGLADAAENYIALHNFTKAKEYLDKAMAIFAKLDERRMLAGVNQIYGMFYRKLGKYQQSLNRFRKCIELAYKLKDFEILSKSYFEVGKLYKAKGVSESAKKQFEKALRIYKKLGNELECREVEKELRALPHPN